TDAHTPELYSIMGDLTGFAHLDANIRPDDAHFMNNGVANDLAAAWAAGNIAAYTCDNKKSPLVITTDGGATWNPAPKLPERSTGGTVALTKDGSALFWVPGTLGAQVYFTTDLGTTWYKPNGLGRGAVIYPDKLEDNIVYAICSGSIYLSKDSGVNFAPTGLTVSENSELVPVMDQKGAVWIRSGTGIGYSEDYASTVDFIKGVSANAMGAGKSKEELGTMPLYFMGEANGLGSGIYMTEDHGRHFSKLTTEKDGFGNLTPSITGDASTYGKFYFATNGRGIVLGQVTP
ncbi:MAG: hypothetical protein IKQ91_03015, partial [Oscillospiraceae bacterium]|nr:hypothetical protein [Oscillospiraceae bacterium]